ncbi:thylakoid membrane protein TERC, chloroplastic isoform X1 [Iris pallida]|uniref:Thylakoid membrane protein TERC, chloroplastic isoform X1 n=1 Tax=Iris pallida TaxID=29817 RepID=A0AAX6E465_IRIPA|nr:thylakoid membrane protein TERC, chloroplastic isoform X1 [Iris pallida]
MRYVVAVHHQPCLQFPPKFDPSISRAKSTTTTIPFSFCSTLRHPSLSFGSGSSRHGWRPPPVHCVGGAEEEDSSVTEDMLKSSLQSHDEPSNVDPSALEPSSADEQDHRASSVRNVILCVSAAVTFGIALGLKEGVGKASEYFAGYLLELSLSIDNLFEFVLIFKYFKVPGSYQSTVLSYGIAGAVIFRAIMIVLGTATLQRFEAVNLLLASILLYSSYKMFSAEEEETDLSDNFVVKTCQKVIPVTDFYDGDRFFTIQDGIRKATPLLLTLAVIEVSDIAFAVDSIPAVFGVTRDPFIVFTSNMFAISGLRSLYLLISGSLSELDYLQPAVGVVLGFIGTKMILDFFGYRISTMVSLGVVATSLIAGVLLSLLKRSDDERSE